MTRSVGTKSKLGLPFGRYVTGGFGHTDVAFEAFTRTVQRVAQHATFECFITNVERLERELVAIGGYDEELAEAFESASGLSCSSEDIAHFDQMTGFASDIEEFASAFFLTIQTRLAAVRAAGAGVYLAARRDGLPDVACKRPYEIVQDRADVWGVANFIKHSDEWGPELKTDQRRTYAMLEKLGVASEKMGQRSYRSYLVLEAAHRITDGAEPSSAALRQIGLMCEQSCEKARRDVLDDFERHAEQLSSIRAINKANRLAKMRSQ